MRRIPVPCLAYLVCVLPIAVASVFSPLNSWAVTIKEEAKLLPGDGAIGDQFGYSVALDSDTAVVGAAWHDDEIGAAYVFARAGGVWTQQTKLLDPDGAPDDNFGWSVAVSGDTALVGSKDDRDNGFQSGSAFVFTRAGGVWTLQAKLLASDGAQGDHFGISVALDGDTAVIGAYGDDDNGSVSGSAYVFIRAGGTWSQQAKLLAAAGEPGDFFGESVALNADTAVVGAPWSAANPSSRGFASVFTRVDGVWTEEARLVDPAGDEDDQFGRSVAVSNDTTLVGNPWADGATGGVSGSASVFTRMDGAWTRQALLPAPEDALLFGWSVSLDGDSALVGAYAGHVNLLRSGLAFVFTRVDGVWTEEAKLLPVDGVPDGAFGIDVALDGDVALIGASRDDDNGPESGSAYVFRRNDGDVPAMGGSGAVLLCLAMLGAGAYFLRRRWFL